MKAAGEISEYEQAQMLKKAMEVSACPTIYKQTYKSSLEAIKGKANPTVQMIVAYSDALDLSLKLSNYLTE